jgi:hypothetical protein
MLKKTHISYALDMNGYTGGHASAAGADGALPGGGRERKNERQYPLWLVLLIVSGLAGCQKPAPEPPRAGPAENTMVLPPAPPKSYTERTNDRMVLIKDRLQLLKDQAAPLSGPTLRMADARIKSIEADVHAADKVVGHLRRQTVPPAQQAALNRQLGQIEQEIDATSQAIASSQGRR